MSMLTAVTGARPRGRCSACGKDSALTPSGTVWSHQIPSGMLSLLAPVSGWPGYYECVGSAKKPMTAGQWERFDEWVQAKRTVQRAELERREEQHLRASELAGQQELAKTRWAFRSFNEQSFAACPWHSQRVTFIAIAADAPVTFACDVASKRVMLRSEYSILVAWPGEWSQHVFKLSDQDKTAVLAVLSS